MAIIAPLPFTLTNGTTADATQVMADLNAIANAVNSNAAHNGANNDITSLSGLTTPIAPSQGGTAEYAGGVSTGSANAQVISTLPNNFVALPGNRVTWIAGFTNSGAMTLNVDGQGAFNLMLRTSTGALALQGGEVVAGLAFSAEFDGVQFELLDPITLTSLSNALAVDVSLNNAALYFDGPSVTQGTAGIWFASASVTVLDTAGLSTFDAKLWDGTTVAASTQGVSTGANSVLQMSLSGIISAPAGNIRISVRDQGAATGVMKANVSAAGKDSVISAVRLR